MHGLTAADVPTNLGAAADRLGAVARAIVLRAVLHQLDPATHPLATAPDTLEGSVLARLQPLAGSALAALRPHLERLLAEPARRDPLLGLLAGVDLRAPDLEAPYAALVAGHSAAPTAAAPAAAPAVRPPYGTAHLLVRYLQCWEPMHPGGDELLVGGLRVGATGIVRPIAPLFYNRMRAGERHPSGNITLASARFAETPLPRTMACLVQLLETRNAGSHETGAALLELAARAGEALALLAGHVPGELLPGLLLLALEPVVPAFTEQPLLPMVALILGMEREDPFRQPMGPRWRAPALTAGDGRYTLGYRWRLSP